MGDYYQNMAILFVPEDQQELVPAIVASMVGDDHPFDFNQMMPGGHGGGISGAVIEAMKDQDPINPNEKLKFDCDLIEKIKAKNEHRWGCQSNALFFNSEQMDECVKISDLDDHNGYENQPCSVKISWQFDTKNGTPDELAERFCKRAASLGMGAMWFYESTAESKWNPVTEEHVSQWHELAETYPEEISETQRIRNSVNRDKLFLMEEEEDET